MEIVLESILIGIVGWVFCLILIDDGMVFDKWWVVLNKLPMWLAKPLGACEYCFTGQMALWIYLYKYHSTYGLLEHITYISVGIFTVRIINKYIYGS